MSTIIPENIIGSFTVCPSSLTQCNSIVPVASWSHQQLTSSSAVSLQQAVKASTFAKNKHKVTHRNKWTAEHYNWLISTWKKTGNYKVAADVICMLLF